MDIVEIPAEFKGYHCFGRWNPPIRQHVEQLPSLYYPKTM
jgi:hypothetical protein